MIIASRSVSKCEDAVMDIKTRFPQSPGKLISEALDTSDLDSVSKFADKYLSQFARLGAYYAYQFNINIIFLRFLSITKIPQIV